MAYFQHVGAAPIIINISRAISVRFERAQTPGSIKNLSVEAATHPDITKLTESGRLLPLQDDEAQRRLAAMGAAGPTGRGLSPRNKGSHSPGQQSLRPRATFASAVPSPPRGDNRQPRNVFAPAVQRGVVEPTPPVASEAGVSPALLVPSELPEAPIVSTALPTAPAPAPVDVLSQPTDLSAVFVPEEVEAATDSADESSEPGDAAESSGGASEGEELKIGKTTRGRKRQS